IHCTGHLGIKIFKNLKYVNDKIKTEYNKSIESSYTESSSLSLRLSLLVLSFSVEFKGTPLACNFNVFMAIELSLASMCSVSYFTYFFSFDIETIKIMFMYYTFIHNKTIKPNTKRISITFELSSENKTFMHIGMIDCILVLHVKQICCSFSLGFCLQSFFIDVSLVIFTLSTGLILLVLIGSILMFSLRGSLSINGVISVIPKSVKNSCFIFNSSEFISSISNLVSSITYGISSSLFTLISSLYSLHLDIRLPPVNVVDEIVSSYQINSRLVHLAHCLFVHKENFNSSITKFINNFNTAKPIKQKLIFYPSLYLVFATKNSLGLRKHSTETKVTSWSRCAH
ncbi:hypothetical protein AGLY_008862, partial [Aphis glycines]